MTSKINTYLGFAVRANKVAFGLEMTLKSKVLPKVVLCDNSLGKSARYKIDYYCKSNGVDCFYLDENYLNDTLKRNNVKIVAVCDLSLGEQIISILKQK